MADINRNEEKVPAPEEIHGLAAALDQFGADFDPYEYMDTVEDKEQNIRDTERSSSLMRVNPLLRFIPTTQACRTR